MTTRVDFVASTTTVFNFQPVLDGAQYNATVTWNVFGERYYVNVYDLSGTLIAAVPLIGSGPLIPATFVQSGGIAVATTDVAHNVPIGTIAKTVVSGTGGVFDGTWLALATTPTTLRYAVETYAFDPSNGNVDFPINLLGGYFTSTLVFRQATQQFEY